MIVAPIATTASDAAITIPQNGVSGSRLSVSAAAAASSPTYDQLMKYAWYSIHVFGDRRRAGIQPAMTVPASLPPVSRRRSTRAARLQRHSYCSS